MKLFFKHLARSIVKKPLQPIILVFTLTLAIIVSIFSLSMQTALDEETRLGQAAKYGNAQITVGLNGTSSSRFMFTKDVEDVLDGEGVAAGTFELPLAVGEENKTVFGVAVDFTEVGKVFDFTFIEYGEITPSTVSQAAFITQSFANDNALSVGDEFTVTAFGENKSYTVCGIARLRFMDSYDVMVDITGVIRLITDGSPLLSALGDNFKPSSTIFVRLNDTASVSECIEKLQADARFEEKNLTDVSVAMREKSNVVALSYIIDVFTLLAALLAASVTFCCFYIIASERTEENYTFTLSGAKPWMLNLIQYAEIVFYWVISAALGCGLSMPITEVLFSVAGFRYASSAVRPLQMIFGAGILLFVALATVTLFIATQKMKRKNRPEKVIESKVVFLLFALAAGLSVFAFIAPMGARFGVYIALVVAICTFLFVAMPTIVKWLTEKLNTSADQRFFATYRVKHIPLRYAVKNVFSVKFLHNISRLVALLTCILTSSLLMVAAAYGNLGYSQDFFNADYIVLNATESCAEKIVGCETVQIASRAYFGQSGAARIIAADDVAAIAEDIKITQLPKGNQAILSYGEAKSRSMKIGDTFTQMIDGREVELVVFDIVKAGITFVMFDCEHFGISYNMMAVKGKADVDNAMLLQDLTDKTALELAAVIAVEDLFAEKLQTINICLRLGVIFVSVVGVFAAVGMVDNLYESYRARREEFGLYACSGMSGKEIRRMKLWEMLLTFASGIVLGGVCFVVLSFASDACFLTFGFEMLTNVRKFFL